MQTHEILHIAKLSRLKLSAEEIPVHVERFRKILDMVNAIQSVNTEGISPMRHPFDAKMTSSQLREDVPNETAESFVLTTKEDPYFYVPKVIE